MNTVELCQLIQENGILHRHLHGCLGPIRELFASTTEAHVRGYKAGRFSFNVPGGRCENREGHGETAIENAFFANGVRCLRCLSGKEI